MIDSEAQVLEAARKVLHYNLAIRQAEKNEGDLIKGYAFERDLLLEAIREYDARVNPDRKGPWFFTARGHRFWREDPRPQDIHIEDIAHNLSLLCRFCGNVSAFYSVAQHSVLVSDAVRSEAAVAGLLHDAAEAYLGDVVSPVKRGLPAFSEMEGRIMEAVCLRFELPQEGSALWREVKRADNSLLATEFRDLACGNARLGEFEEPPLDFVIQPWVADAAERIFLAAFLRLTS